MTRGTIFALNHRIKAKLNILIKMCVFFVLFAFCHFK